MVIRSTINRVINSKGIIALMAVLLALVVPVWAGLAQSPTPPNPRDALIQEIQARAQRDAEQEVRQSTSDLKILFGDEAERVGLTMREVVDVYDRAYQAAYAPRPWWRDLLTLSGWMVVVIAVVQKMFGKYLAHFFEWLIERAYLRLAGYRPFWTLALHRYRRALVREYRTLKVPFRPGRPLDMTEIYVPLKVVGESQAEAADAYESIAEHRRLMITGAPGAGKTMLLKHLALTYAQEGLDAIPGRPIPVFLELHRLNEDADLRGQLEEALARNKFPNSGNFLKANLEGGNLLLLFDGLDEVNRERRETVVQQIKDLLTEHHACRAVVTCRTAVYRGEFDNWADRRLEIVEFDDQQIRRFLIPWGADMPADKSVAHLLRTLRERPRILALARNPLLLTIIAYLYADTAFVLPHSRAEFYRKASEVLLEQWKEKRNWYKASHKRLVLRHLALFNQDRPAEKSQDRRSIGLMEVLEQIKEVLPSLELKDADAEPILDEIVERSGLLLRLDGGEKYQFTHQTLQEYFAAEELADKGDALVSRFEADPDTWRETVKLWCGLEHDSTPLLRKIHRRDPLTALECLGDTRQVAPDFAAQIVADFQARLLDGEADERTLEAIAVVAADPRPRGERVLRFLTETVADGERDERVRLAAGRSLSMTNMPAAAETLAAHLAALPDLRPLLARMGNLAVKPLSQLAGEGHDWAVDDLRTIGTPEAARALLPFLWDERETLRYRAAWALGSLFDKPGVEESLRTWEPTPAQRQAGCLEWVWAPFEEGRESPLPVIAGRVAYLMVNTPEEMLPVPPVPLDPDDLVPGPVRGFPLDHCPPVQSLGP